jgi:hypothetical protein
VLSVAQVAFDEALAVEPSGKYVCKSIALADGIVTIVDDGFNTAGSNKPLSELAVVCSSFAISAAVSEASGSIVAAFEEEIVVMALCVFIVRESADEA